MFWVYWANHCLSWIFSLGSPVQPSDRLSRNSCKQGPPHFERSQLLWAISIRMAWCWTMLDGVNRGLHLGYSVCRWCSIVLEWPTTIRLLMEGKKKTRCPCHSVARGSVLGSGWDIIDIWRDNLVFYDLQWRLLCK